MKIVFFGTGEFGIPTLKKILDSGCELTAAVTQPDKRRGRGWNVQAAPVKAIMEQLAPGIDILQPDDVSDAVFLSFLKKRMPDVFLVVDYGKKLPKELLAIPRKYCINLHPSLLPKYRGPAPVNWAILNGEEETGNTVIRITARMDAGDIIAQEKTRIKENENAKELSERLSQSGANFILKVLGVIEAGKENFIRQDESLVSYAPKLGKAQGRIDWSNPAQDIIKKVRGLQPWPSAFTYLDGKILKIFGAQTGNIKKPSSVPGTIIDAGNFVVSTQDGALQVDRLQLEGRKEMDRKEFLRGFKLEEGTVLG